MPEQPSNFGGSQQLVQNLKKSHATMQPERKRELVLVVTALSLLGLFFVILPRKAVATLTPAPSSTLPAPSSTPADKDRIEAARVALLPDFPTCPRPNIHKKLVRVGQNSTQHEHYSSAFSGQKMLWDLYTDESASHIFQWRRAALPLDLQDPGHTIKGRVCSGTPIPIFVILRDRFSTLKECLRAMHEAIATPFEIVIINQGSSYPPLLAYLSQLSTAGMEVINVPGEMATSNGAVHTMLEKIAPHIDHFMEKSKSEFYVVSDPDIALFGSPHGNILHVIASLLRAFPEKQIIGPTMRVDDVPPHSAFHELIGVDGMGYETAMWPEQLESFKFQKRRFYWCKQCNIDTTFGMRRKGYYKRLDGQGARLMPPYGARHLDWYLDAERAPEDMLFYLCTQKLAKAIATHSYPLVSGFNCSEFIANISNKAARIDVA